MATGNLFGQYYSTKTNKRGYQNVDYVCANAADEDNNAIVFGDGALNLIDTNGNVITSLDLSSIAAKPIVDYRTGVITLMPGETRLVEGLDYGKSYAKVYFKIPTHYIQIMGDDIKDYVNVSFNILFNVEWDLREFHVETVLDTDSINDDLITRIQNLINLLGLEKSITVSEDILVNNEGEEEHYIVFTSNVLGYDFTIADFKFHNIDCSFIYDDINDIYIPSTDKVNLIYGVDIENAEDDVHFPNGTSLNSNVSANENIGNYDTKDDDNDDKDDHYYNEDTFALDTSVDSSIDSSILEPVSDDLYHYDEDLKEYILDDKYISVDEDLTKKVYALKYPNGAARVWFFVPDMFDDDNLDYYPVKLNHVRDYITLYTPAYNKVDTLHDVSTKADLDLDKDGYTDEHILFEDDFVKVDANKRIEAERHNITLFHLGITSDASLYYKDEINGKITEVAPDAPVHSAVEFLDEQNDIKHIGMYRYIDFVEQNQDWINVGQFYGLITPADLPDSNIKHLANSVYLYNPNEFAIKINYFIGV